MPRYDRTSFVISDMAAGDLEEVLAIERALFPTPWTENTLRQELLFPRARNLTARIAGEGIAGFLNYWLIADEIHLHRIAVREDRQAQGAGTALLEEMMARGLLEGARQATLEVRRSNEPARGLYERFGFAVQGIRQAYYEDGKEDALIMWAELGENKDGRR